MTHLFRTDTDIFRSMEIGDKESEQVSGRKKRKVKRQLQFSDDYEPGGHYENLAIMKEV